MRVFWSVLALCMLGAGVWVYTSRLGGTPAPPSTDQQTSAPFESVKPTAPVTGDAIVARETPKTPPNAEPAPDKPAPEKPASDSPAQALDAALGTTEKPVAQGPSAPAPAAAPQTPEERQAESERDLLYTVQPGETLVSIANKFFSEPTLGPRLGAYNADALKSSGYLTTGMQIRIPARRDTLMRDEYALGPGAQGPNGPKGNDTAAPANGATPAADSNAASKPDAAKPSSNAPREEKAVADGEAKIETRPDGTTLVDDKYVLKGEGTDDKPYEITWEYLTSASSVYDPSKGKKKIPGRITMLDGKRVKITGYVAYPLYVDEPKELLSMLNQWDGCCIGVPPTPYDAIEVHLAGTVSKEDRLASYGSVAGKFQVKPYLVGEWLVGLYVMEDASLKARGHGGGE